MNLTFPALCGYPHKAEFRAVTIVSNSANADGRQFQVDIRFVPFAA